MTYIQKKTYEDVLSDLRLISRALREAGYMSSAVHMADQHVLQAAGALEAAIEETDAVKG